ncbi:hypothetical protein ACT009_11960 [Sphingomonas sp. Tas61C01]|uniref:hypothetical protein n=1 Tax=Sphingomonas sp. Tas61C01 TaxID=3458297 RepID=UPI00403E9454
MRLVLSCAALFSAIGTAQAQVAAGTVITNVANLQVPGANGGEQTIASNPATLTVGEILDVALVRSNGATGAVAADAGSVAAVTLTNRGNGSEAFVVVASPADTSVRVRLIAIDVDGDGRFDPQRDSVLGDDRLTPPVAPGATLALLVVLDSAGTAAVDTALMVTATAATGSGAAGTVYPGRGDGGGDAIVGSTGATARLSIPVAGTPTAAPRFEKTQSVRAPDGSTAAVRGSIVTYTLAATFTGAITGARIHDGVPAGTTYVAGSLRLDGATLSDTADADAGGFDAGAIDVALGDVPAAARRTVTFQVKIQ